MKSDENTKHVEEAKIDEEVMEILGEDPLKVKTLDTKLHSEIQKRLKFWFDNGIDKEERETLLEKYKVPSGLETHKLNPEISLKLAKHSRARDMFMSKRQQLAGSAISSIGWAMTNIIEDKISIDKPNKNFLLERLNDACKLISDSMHSQTRSRIALILPAIDKDTRGILEDTEPGEFLFGNNLSEKIKDAKKMEKLALNLRKNSGFKNQSAQIQRFPLNSNGLQGRRPLPNQAGTVQGQPMFQSRPRGPFRPRPQVPQFIPRGQPQNFNPRMQTRFK